MTGMQNASDRLNQRRQVHGHVRRQRQAVGRRHGDIFRQGSLQSGDAVLSVGFALVRISRGAVRAKGLGAAAHAIDALIAEDPVAHFQVGDLLPDFHDFTAELVPSIWGCSVRGICLPWASRL